MFNDRIATLYRRKNCNKRSNAYAQGVVVDIILLYRLTDRACRACSLRLKKKKSLRQKLQKLYSRITHNADQRGNWKRLLGNYQYPF